MKNKYYLILLVYYLMVVLPHEEVGAFIAGIFLPGSRLRYNGIMLAILMGILIVVGIWLLRKVRPKDKKLLLAYIGITLVLIAICINILFVLNVEAIHFIQYAVFAIICFQLTNSYFRTMFWSLLAGAIDELYQYVYLAPQRTDYYDFNDVLINGVGAGIGLLIIRTIEKQSKHFQYKIFFRSAEFWTMVVIAFLVIVGFVTNVLSYGPNPLAKFCFLKIEDINFWHVVPPDIKFHVVKPIEGLLFSVVILVIYSGLQRGSVDIFERSENK